MDFALLLFAMSKSLQEPAMPVAALQQHKSGRAPPKLVTLHLFWTAVALQISLSICLSYNDKQQSYNW